MAARIVLPLLAASAALAAPATTSFDEWASTSSKGNGTGIQVFLDFDDTIVTSDAFSTLAYAAVDSLPANYTGTTWDEIEDVYGQIYDAASASIEEPSTNLTAQIAYEDNEVLRAVEVWSVVYTKETGLFDTVKKSELEKYARNVTLRDGWCSFATAAQNAGVHIHVVSRNWSPSWIRLVLQEASACPGAASTIATYCPDVLPAGVLPYSKLDHPSALYSGADKVRLITQILADIPASQKEKVVFASDGAADLSTLWLEPTNIGVVAGFNNSAAEAFQKYGYEILPVSEGYRGYSGTAGNESFVYGFEDFRDLESFLFN